jgi:hypothetical protein
MAGLAYVYSTWRPDPRIAAGTYAMLQLVVISAVGGLLSYVAASPVRPLWDDNFARWDAALGLDWRAYFDAVTSRPLLHAVLRAAYHAMMPAFAVAVLALTAARRFERLQLFVMAFALSCFGGVMISAILPALNAYAHAGLVQTNYFGVELAATTQHLAHLSALRDGSLRVLSLSGIEGIITFPSMHTAIGVLLIWALWPVPVMRWISLGFNLAMIATTPVDGSHYFVDVLAGAVLAIAAVTVCVAISRWRDAPRGVLITAR